jgi:hypothetical protein
MRTLRRFATPLVCLTLLLMASSLSAQVIILNGPGGTGVPGPPGPAGAVTGTFLMSGGAVVWISGYTFRVSAAVYFINGTQYTSAEQNVTLAAANATLDRIDAITLDTSSTASSIAGQPSAPPFEPTVDPSLYLRLTHVLVTHATTQPPGVVSTVIYDEGVGGEWTPTPSAGTFVVGSTNNPNTGTKDIEGTSVALGDQVTFVKPTPPAIDLATQAVLVFYLRVKTAWAPNKRIRLLWMNGASSRGQFVDVRTGLFGFNSQLVGAYQQIVVPASQFLVPPGATVDTLIWRIIGGGPNPGFYLDTMQLQAGTNQPPPASGPGGAIGSVQFNDQGNFNGFGSWDGTTLSVPGFVNVGTRSGTPSTFATFDTSGNLVAGPAFSVGGGGSVTTFSAGNLSPLFTTSVVNPTTAPALSFALSTAANSTIYSNISGGVAAPAFNTSTAVFDNQLGSTRGSVAIRGVSSWSALTPGTAGLVLTTQGAGADPIWASASPGAADKRRVCNMTIGSDDGSALSNAALGPQGRVCLIPAASTVVEVNVAADAGTPNVIVRKNSNGAQTNLISGALATAAAGGIACSNTGGTTALNGVTTCTNTLTVTTLAQGDYLELTSGTAGGTAKRMSIFVVYTIN